MRFSTFATVAGATLFAKQSLAGYTLEDDYMKDFYGAFDFFDGPDPTHGFVKYVNEGTARDMKLINASTTVPVEWGVDTSSKTPEGRPSIRLESKKKYNGGLIVIDVQHMPFGCGTWPAFWMFGPDWPKGGEIDILEGVNEDETNGMTLHTGPGCKVGPDKALFEGKVDTEDCDVNAEGQGKNVGCKIKHPSPKSYGAGLNEIGGGVYATEWTKEAISIWFFPRGDIPKDVLGENPQPSTWGKPAAKFQGGCDIPSMFADNRIIFDTTFCGDWAGAVWETGSCKSKAPTCDEFVRDNPEAFKNAYWTVNALKVYQDNGKGEGPKEDPPKEDPPKEDPPKEDPPKENPPKEDPPTETPTDPETPPAEPETPSTVPETPPSEDPADKPPVAEPKPGKPTKPAEGIGAPTGIAEPPAEDPPVEGEPIESDPTAPVEPGAPIDPADPADPANPTDPPVDDLPTDGPVDESPPIIDPEGPANGPVDESPPIVDPNDPIANNPEAPTPTSPEPGRGPMTGFNWPQRSGMRTQVKPKPTRLPVEEGQPAVEQEVPEGDPELPAEDPQVPEEPAAEGPPEGMKVLTIVETRLVTVAARSIPTPVSRITKRRANRYQGWL